MTWRGLEKASMLRITALMRSRLRRMRGQVVFARSRLPAARAFSTTSVPPPRAWRMFLMWWLRAATVCPTAARRSDFNAASYSRTFSMARPVCRPTAVSSLSCSVE
ncbi:MAG: hypothetical protein B1H04_05480 [Planctomycetales bacterium 4484_123]|nr:MAG: hypothetical protein B1H04_05480 [Planctomycetales bacterium 4484_123]